MKESTGATARVLLSFGVIIAVLALAITIAKVIQSNDKLPGAADAEASVESPDAEDEEHDAEAASEISDAGVDGARAETLCDTIAKEIEATAAKKLGSEMTDASGWLLPDLFRDAHCVATRSGGIWAMVPTGVRARDSSPELEVLWEVLHVSSKGTRVTLAQAPFVSSVDRSLDLEQPSVFDYDGDGQDEVILTGASWVRDGASSPFARVWTLHGKKIEPYAAAPEFTAVEDVDDDVRLDLLTNGPYVAEPLDGGTPCGPERRVAGPLLLLHSRADGTFSGADEEAIAYAKKACPARPKSILGKAGADAASPKASPDNLACARLWGSSEADLTALLTKDCRGLRAAFAGTADSGVIDGGRTACLGDIVCDEAPRFRSWMHAKPPLLLK